MSSSAAISGSKGEDQPCTDSRGYDVISFRRSNLSVREGQGAVTIIIVDTVKMCSSRPSECAGKAAVKEQTTAH
eukprot:4555684-Karenia_brevis.AAC.1